MIDFVKIVALWSKRLNISLFVYWVCWFTMGIGSYFFFQDVYTNYLGTYKLSVMLPFGILGRVLLSVVPNILQGFTMATRSAINWAQNVDQSKEKIDLPDADISTLFFVITALFICAFAIDSGLGFSYYFSTAVIDTTYVPFGPDALKFISLNFMPIFQSAAMAVGIDLILSEMMCVFAIALISNLREDALEQMYKITNLSSSSRSVSFRGYVKKGFISVINIIWKRKNVTKKAAKRKTAAKSTSSVATSAVSRAAAKAKPKQGSMFGSSSSTRREPSRSRVTLNDYSSQSSGWGIDDKHDSEIPF